MHDCSGARNRWSAPWPILQNETTADTVRYPYPFRGMPSSDSRMICRIKAPCAEPSVKPPGAAVWNAGTWNVRPL